MTKLSAVALAAIVAAAFASPCFAAASAPTSLNELYAGIGTTGGTVGYGYAFGPHTAVRVEANYLNYSRTINTSSADYRGTLKLSTLGVYYDAFFAGPFRATFGALVGSNKFTGNAIATNGTVTINHAQYSAAGQWARGTVKFKNVSPYIGLGFGHRPERGGFGCYGDVGVAYGHPTVTLAVSQGLKAEAGSANIQAEQANLQHKANKLKFYPVLRLGVDYQW